MMKTECRAPADGLPQSAGEIGEKQPRSVSTEGFWQEFYSADRLPGPPYRDRFPVEVAPGKFFDLPLRMLPGTDDRAVASLIINHASFAVADWFAERMAELAVGLRSEMIVGLPTLGLAIAPIVAHQLGFENFVAMGYSRKFWYDDALSEDVSSVTTPSQGKRIYVDPNLLPRLAGRRVVIVDDAVSRGTTMTSARRLLGKIGVDVVGAVTIMAQTERWKSVLDGFDVRSVFATPLFERRSDGWWPV